MKLMRNNWPMEIHAKRELADISALRHMAGDRPTAPCNRAVVDGASSKRSTIYCHYRYPSPRRFGPSGTGPTPLSTLPVGELRRFQRAAHKWLVLCAESADSSAHRNLQNKGSHPWFISVYCSPPRPSLRSRRASRMILSAGSQVQPLAHSSQMQWAAMSSRGPLLAAPQVRCATKSPAPVTRTQFRNTQRPSGRPTHITAVPDASGAAVLRSSSKSIGDHHV